jgi:signal peptide peptidase SppA
LKEASPVLNPQSAIPNPQSASGLILGAQEAGLRESLRRVSSALAVGRMADQMKTAAAHDRHFAAVDPMGAGGVPGSGGTPALVVSKGVAVIDVVGPLSKGADLYNWLFGTLTYGQLCEQLDSARRDSRVQGVLLRIDSPGGMVAGVSDLCDAILRTRASKPVIACISDLGASCAYQVAACANRVFVDRDGWAGSIGVFVVIDDVSQMYADVGWKVRVFATAADPYKGAGVAGSPITDPQAAEYQRVVDEMGGEMIRAIYEARPRLKTSGMVLPDGRVYLGQDAMLRGLVDAVAAWPDVLAAMQDGDYAAAKAGNVN